MTKEDLKKWLSEAEHRLEVAERALEFNGAPVDSVTIEKDDMEYKYGMRLRGFSPGCQPMNGFVRREDDITGTYHDIIVYNRPLTAEERKQYELDDMTEAEK